MGWGPIADLNSCIAKRDRCVPRSGSRMCLQFVPIRATWRAKRRRYRGCGIISTTQMPVASWNSIAAAAPEVSRLNSNWK